VLANHMPMLPPGTWIAPSIVVDGCCNKTVEVKGMDADTAGTLLECSDQRSFRSLAVEGDLSTDAVLDVVGDSLQCTEDESWADDDQGGGIALSVGNSNVVDSIQSLVEDCDAALSVGAVAKIVEPEDSGKGLDFHPGPRFLSGPPKHFLHTKKYCFKMDARSVAEVAVDFDELLWNADVEHLIRLVPVTNASFLMDADVSGVWQDIFRFLWLCPYKNCREEICLAAELEFGGLQFKMAPHKYEKMLNAVVAMVCSVKTSMVATLRSESSLER